MENKEDLIRATIRELMRIARLFGRVEEMPVPVTGDLSVSTREAHTVEAVGEQEYLSVTQLAAHFGITKSAASQMVSKLVKRGFVAKKQAAHSNKEYELFLTPLGREVCDAHERFHGEDMNALVSRLSVFSLSQIATLSVLLEALGSAMDHRLDGKLKP
jgi:DNA-binding MarR family transcriptional regulator